MPLDGLFAGIGSVISTAIGSRTARRNTDKTNRANRELAEYAYSKDLEMWQRQNEYNSPANQMKRFEEGGLNPHLIYGQGTPGNASQMPTYNAPRMDYNYTPAFDPGNALMEFNNFRQSNANIDLAKQKIQTEKAVTDLNGFRADGVFQENSIRAIETTIAQYIMNNQLGDLSDIAKGRIGAMKADDWLRVATSEIRQWEKTLTDNNVNPRDTLMWRQIFDFLELIGFSPNQIRKKLGE